MKTKYLTFGIDADSIKTAKPRLERLETDILNNFKRMRVIAESLSGQQRLRVLHDILRMDTPEPFLFDWKWLPKTGLSTKDFIAPSSFYFGRARDFRMGKKFCRVSFLQILAPELSDRILKDFLDVEFNIHTKCPGLFQGTFEAHRAKAAIGRKIHQSLLFSKIPLKNPYMMV